MAVRHRSLFVILTGLVFLAIALFLSRSASREAARTTESPAEVSFATLGGVEDWRADGTSGLYVRGRNRQWYYAKFTAPCVGSSAPEQIQFVITPASPVDRLSAAILGDRTCAISTLRQSAEPARP